MANWANPTLTSTYVDFLAEVKARDEDLAKMFDGQTVSNLPSGAIRWSSANNRFEKWSGSAWGALSATYAFTAVTAIGTLTVGANADTGQTASLTIGNGRTGNGFVSLDIIGDTTYTTYAVRLARFGTGANAETNFYHRGTGTFRMNCQDGGSWGVQISGTDRLVVDGAGDITISRRATVGGLALTSSSTISNGFNAPVSDAIAVRPGTYGEVARWTSTGQYLHGATSLVNMTENTTEGLHIGFTGAIFLRQYGSSPINLSRSGTNGAIQQFYQTNTLVGSISVTTTATAYNTSSDYRLKENVAPIDDPIALLMQLKPCGFNFKAEPSQRVNGFIAHELADVIHEAVTGEKDAEDEDGNPIYQGVDQAKLVPVLTAAMQELVERVTRLEQPE